ncbi:hypothetical protein [Elizabethkingia ursingii]|uniref:Phage abortive infection protein n=1 Tax=Elizabethkingia ursingii TaxID=1756150 RepID=A0ABX3N309_9FLAO|nr:hypothetical protein [Elizabethkingia ursingii]OPB84429.1 hypothetical protein BB021_16945 [Elizabethkingia ursingii]
MYFTIEPEFVKNIIGDIIGASIGTGTALAIFYLTIRNDKEKEQDRIRNESENRNENFINLLKSSVLHLVAVDECLSRMINQFDSDIINFPLMEFTPDKSFDRLEEYLGNENYFQSFVYVYGVNCYNNLTKSIDYFNTQLRNIIPSLEKTRIADYENKIKYKELSKQAIRYIVNLRFDSCGINKSNMQVIMNILKEYNIASNSNNYSLKFDIAFLTRFLEEGLGSEINNNRVINILETIKDAYVFFEEIQFQNIVTKENLILIREKMRAAKIIYSKEIITLEEISVNGKISKKN